MPWLPGTGKHPHVHMFWDLLIVCNALNNSLKEGDCIPLKIERCQRTNETYASASLNGSSNVAPRHSHQLMHFVMWTERRVSEPPRHFLTFINKRGSLLNNFDSGFCKGTTKKMSNLGNQSSRKKWWQSDF